MENPGRSEVVAPSVKQQIRENPGRSEVVAPSVKQQIWESSRRRSGALCSRPGLSGTLIRLDPRIPSAKLVIVIVRLIFTELTKCQVCLRKSRLVDGAGDE